MNVLAQDAIAVMNMQAEESPHASLRARGKRIETIPVVYGGGSFEDLCDCGKSSSLLGIRSGVQQERQSRCGPKALGRVTCRLRRRSHQIGHNVGRRGMR